MTPAVDARWESAPSNLRRPPKAAARSSGGQAEWETEMGAQTLQIIGYFLAGWIFGGLAFAMLKVWHM